VTPPTVSTDDAMHIILLAMSVILVAVSLNGFRKRPNTRYFFLLVAFLFFFLDQAATFWQQLYYNDEEVTLPFVGLHLTHLLEFLMAVSFLVALANPGRLQWGVSDGHQV
jgi:hypothetical protein